MQIVFSAIYCEKYMSLAEWKRNVKNVVLKRDERRIQMNCKLYKVLQNIHIPDMKNVQIGGQLHKRLHVLHTIVELWLRYY